MALVSVFGCAPIPCVCLCLCLYLCLYACRRVECRHSLKCYILPLSSVSSLCVVCGPVGLSSPLQSLFSIVFTMHNSPPHPSLTITPHARGPILARECWLAARSPP